MLNERLWRELREISDLTMLPEVRLDSHNTLSILYWAFNHTGRSRRYCGSATVYSGLVYQHLLGEIPVSLKVLESKQTQEERTLSMRK